MGEYVFTNVVTFPFEQIGSALRAMSLSGGPGNAAAWVIFMAIGLLPAGYLVFRAIKRKAGVHDLLLGVFSVVLTGGLYLFINPSDLHILVPSADMQDVGKYIAGTVIHSVGFGYLILRAARSPGVRGAAGLKALLAVIIVLLAAKILMLALPGTISAANQISEANTGADPGSITVTQFFLWFGFGVRALSDGMEIAVLFFGINLINELVKDRYAEAACQAAKRLEKACVAAVTITVSGCIILNLSQLLTSRILLKSDYSVQIPLVSIAIIMAALLGSRYLAEGKEIKEENDLFI